MVHFSLSAFASSSFTALPNRTGTLSASTTRPCADSPGFPGQSMHAVGQAVVGECFRSGAVDDDANPTNSSPSSLS
jgi:hypothetical protein